MHKRSLLRVHHEMFMIFSTVMWQGTALMGTSGN